MYTGQLAVISNKATWLSDIVELVDDTDGTITDLSLIIEFITSPGWTVLSTSANDIVITIKDMDNCLRATASIANGKVTIPGPGFQWQFEVSDLSSLCAGTYKIGVKVTLDDFVIDVIIGTVAVIEGN